MANVYKGVGVHWGTDSSSGIYSGTFKTQSSDHNLKAESEMIKDGSGNTVGKVFFDQTEEASFEFIPVSTGSINGVLAPSLPAIGTVITVADSVYTQIAGVYLVDDVSTKRSNTSALRVTLKLTKYPNITS